MKSIDINSKALSRNITNSIQSNTMYNLLDVPHLQNGYSLQPFHLSLDIRVSMGSSCTPTIVATVIRKITDNMTTTTHEGHHQRITHHNTHNQTDNQNLNHTISLMIMFLNTSTDSDDSPTTPCFRMNEYPDETQH